MRMLIAAEALVIAGLVVAGAILVATTAIAAIDYYLHRNPGEDDS